jgi:hypothetical protein
MYTSVCPCVHPTSSSTVASFQSIFGCHERLGAGYQFFITWKQAHSPVFGETGPLEVDLRSEWLWDRVEEKLKIWAAADLSSFSSPNNLLFNSFKNTYKNTYMSWHGGIHLWSQLLLECLKQEDGEFEASLGHVKRPPFLKKNKFNPGTVAHNSNPSYSGSQFKTSPGKKLLRPSSKPMKAGHSATCLPPRLCARSINRRVTV